MIVVVLSQPERLALFTVGDVYASLCKKGEFLYWSVSWTTDGMTSR